MSKTVRLVLDKKVLEKDQVRIKGRPFHYLKRVMRLKNGDYFDALNGEGKQLKLVIEASGRDFLEAKVLEEVNRNAEPVLHVALAQGILKSRWMDVAVKSAVELGISSFVPFTSSRTVPTSASREKQMRWDRIAREACEQSGRTVVPVIEQCATFTAVLSTLSKYDLALIAWENSLATAPIHRVLERSCSPGKVCLLVGPEGGFEDNEVEQALKAGAYAVTLGKRTLRSETAALAFCALVMYELEKRQGAREQGNKGSSD